MPDAMQTDTTIPPRPVPLSVQADQLPPSLYTLRRFVGWKYTWKPDNGNGTPGKWDKPPYVATEPDRLASSTDPRTWRTFADVRAAVEDGKLDGLGITLGPFKTDDDTIAASNRLAAVDLDDCIDEHGTITPQSRTIIDRLNTYTERSPSGRGVRMLLWADRLPTGRRKQKHIEMYNDGRYVTLTGHRIAGTPTEPQERTEAIAAIHASAFPSRNDQRETRGARQQSAPALDLDDTALLERARTARNGGKFSALWAGDTSAYGSPSEADQALTNLLAFWTGADVSRIDRFFRQSGLMRAKWDERRGSQTYGELTIATAIDGCREIYSGEPQHVPHVDQRAPVIVARSRPAEDSAGPEMALPVDIDYARLTDAHAAELLAQRAGGHLRHDQHQGTWYGWQTPTWREDVTGIRQKAVVQLARDVAQHALTLDDLDLRKRVLKFALALESRRGTDNVLELAKHRTPIAVTSDVWDTDLWLLNTPTAIIDLRTLQHRSARPTDLCRQCTGAPYDATATAPRWMRFLDEVFAGDIAVITYLQRLAGYCLTGDVREQIFLLLHGLGANGKTVLLSTLGFVMGTYSHVSPFKAFAQQYGEGGDVPSPELAGLHGKRLITASETRDGTRLDEGRLKNLTGGEVITARHLFSRYFSFKPVGKILLAANHKPKVNDDSLAFWRRCHVIPFTQTFTGPTADLTLADHLRAEASGILNWMLAGCSAWQRDGLNPPATVLLASANYREANDALAGFLHDGTALDAGHDDTTLSREAFAAYKHWADREGLSDRERLGVRTFGERLDDKGYTRFHSRAGVAHRKLKLVTL